VFLLSRYEMVGPGRDGALQEAVVGLIGSLADPF
jgi:hypothetical protein